MEYTNPKNINEFKRILKTLQNTHTANLPELRQLREEQEYLIKLKDQRQKIETLKSKFDQKDKEIKKLQSQNSLFKKQLQNVSNRYSRIEIKYHDEMEKAKQFQSGYKSFEYERERYKQRIMELESEKEDLKRALKNKELTISDVEQDCKRKLKESKESFLIEKRRMIESYQSQFKEIEDSKQCMQEISELEDLIERQNRALKLQEESLIDFNNKSNYLENEIESMRQMYERSMYQNNQLLAEVEFYKNQAQSISKKLKLIEEEEATKRELEYLKLKMNEMRRGEIQSLENVVNQMRN